MMALFACRFSGSATGAPDNENDLLPKPDAGLDGLQSYHVVYEQVIQGTIKGDPFERKVHLEYSAVTQSKEEEFLWQEQLMGGQEFFEHIFRTGDTVYFHSQDGTECGVQYGVQASEDIIRPADLLPAVTGAGKVGSETVNGVDTLHYRFDDAGLSPGGEGTSGEVWVAKQGGYVVKFLLNIPGPAKPSGEGVEVTETRSYEMTDINSIDQIALPDACKTTTMDEIPAMADAKNLLRSGDTMYYATASDAGKVADFYARELPALGWNPVEQPSSGAAVLDYFKDARELMIHIDPSGDGSMVMIRHYVSTETSGEQSPASGPTSTPGVQPTVDADSGFPAEVPPYPGATDLEKQPMGVIFSTGDTPDEVAKYYHDQLPAFGWSLLSEAPSADKIVQTWMKSKSMLIISIEVKSGKTAVTVMVLTQP
jgi:hypothetical protein